MTHHGPGGPSAHDAELRTSLGAYVLGQLDPATTDRVRDHLRACAECRAELTELEPVAAALGELRRGGRAAPVEPSADLGARVTASVDAARRRHQQRTDRRRALGVGAIGGAAVAAALVGGLVVFTGDDHPAPQATIPLEAVPVEVDQPGVTADADLVAHTWGVEVKLSATGFVRGETYRVTVVRRDGVRSPAGEFVGTGVTPMVCNLNSAVLRPRAEGFEVRDDTGVVVVRSHF